jgi:proton-coupled amino acid transporter
MQDLGEVAYGKGFRKVVTCSIVLLQMSICTVYLSFVSGNLQSFFKAFLPQQQKPFTMLGEQGAWSVALVLPVVIGLTLVPNLKALGPISEIAMKVLFLAFALLTVVLIQNAFTNEVDGTDDEEDGQHDDNSWSVMSVNWLHAPMAICGILYTFEGICIVLPLEAAMRERTNFRTLFTKAYAGITILYTCIGVSCVLVFGNVSDGSVTAFLMNHSDQYNGYILVNAANLLVSLAVLLSYALAMIPCIELWCQARERKERGDVLEPDDEEEDWWVRVLICICYSPFASYQVFRD